MTHPPIDGKFLTLVPNEGCMQKISPLTSKMRNYTPHLKYDIWGIIPNLHARLCIQNARTEHPNVHAIIKKHGFYNIQVAKVKNVNFVESLIRD